MAQAVRAGELDDPIPTLQRLSEKLGGCIHVTLKDERIFFLSEVDHFKHVLLTKVDNYGKYFDGLKPIFGNAMITVDGALWQKIRMPQQAAFQPKMFGEYLPYLLSSVEDKARDLEHYAKSGETVNLLEETWGLAASMVCKALFDRDVPFNPKAVFGAVKSYTDVGHHRNIRLAKLKGELTEVPPEDAAAGAIASWLTLIPEVLGAVPRDHRERSLLNMLQAAAADPKPARIRFPASARRDETISLGGHRNDRADADLVLLSPSSSSRGRRTHPPRGRGRLWRSRTEVGRHSRARLYARGDPRDDAALSAGLEPHPRGSR